MSVIWDRLTECKDEIINIFDANAEEYQEPGLDHFNNDTWINRTWQNNNIRRAHIDVVDARESRGLWMMHVCLFPVLNNDGPIYGFDVIAGKNKMTGAFHDFSASSGGEDHPMVEGYKEAVADFIPKKQRQLPEWATNIFTDKMVAAGNVSTEEEAVAIIELALSNLRAYFDEIGEFTGYGNRDETIAAQNYYCDNQQQNPHTPRTMKSLGLNEEDVDRFCTDMLFPKIV
jgi:phycocyanobilin:ferredoxin oxidoreductase|tara:strand:- start:1153 stop:1842 length:690 start_codon:yes stop_codon:yes gene_type:complete